MKSSIDTKPRGSTYTVILDGEDISNRCFAFDSDEGWADCYQLDNNGKIELEEIEPVLGSSWKEYDTKKERLFGTICFYENIKADEIGRKAHSEWIKVFFAGKRENNE